MTSATKNRYVVCQWRGLALVFFSYCCGGELFLPVQEVGVAIFE